MDGLFNLVLILIPLAIFIGRAITHNKRKHAQQQQPPPPPPPPVQFQEEFEDDGNDDLPHWMRAPKRKEVVEKVIEIIQEKEDPNLPHWERGASKTKKQKKEAAPAVSKSIFEKLEPMVVAPLQVEASAAPAIAVPNIAPPLPISSKGSPNVQRPLVFASVNASAGERGLSNLNHLSPLKQAVVMAEILGPPKSER